jgi:hypothetical protein
MKKDDIGNRMKENYEDRYRFKLTRRTLIDHMDKLIKE